jgi:hypothetical protein
LHLHLPKLVKTKFRYYHRKNEIFGLRGLARNNNSTLHITGAEQTEPGDEESLGVFKEKKKGRIVFWGWNSFEAKGVPAGDDRSESNLATSLMETTATLEFPEIELISPSDARRLIAHKGLELSLGIKSMDAPVAMALAEYPGLLVLPRMTAITASAAHELRKCSGVIHLPNLTTATEETRAILKGHPRIETPALED